MTYLQNGHCVTRNIGHLARECQLKTINSIYFENQVKVSLLHCLLFRSFPLSPQETCQRNGISPAPHTTCDKLSGLFQVSGTQGGTAQGRQLIDDKIAGMLLPTSTHPPKKNPTKQEFNNKQ